MDGAHPYLPNALPDIREPMLEAVGAATIDDLFTSIPEQLRAPENLGLPSATLAEADLRRRFTRTLAKNIDTTEYLSFLGGGCWAHYVPAVCDEIAGRGEFWSAFMGMAIASTAGANQAMFEYQSLMAELTGLDVVTGPVYDWAWAAGSALLMATRISGRQRILAADTIGPDRRREISARLPLAITLEFVGHTETGAIDLDDLRAKVDGAAGFYFENPSYLGQLCDDLDEIRQITADADCKLIAGVDPASLGVVRPPGDYGADIAVGDLQPLGHHPEYGGSAAGFMVAQLDPALVSELPSVFLIAIPTVRGDFDYHMGNFEDTSYASRGESTDVIGTSNMFSGLIAGVYLSVMGPQGMTELGNGLRDRVAYLAKRLSTIDGVQVRALAGLAFQECVVDFGGTGLSADEVNETLFERGIFGGIPLEQDFPELPSCALFCVTENHSVADIDRLASTIEEILS
ncbi:MAG: aminomethyl-transferring glycine dehydrogenase subunit GcvPA [Nocardioidaceae bacterium]